MKNKIIILLLILLSVSCSSEKKKEAVGDKNTLSVLGVLAPDIDLSQINAVLVLPMGGCSSCFEEALTLVPRIQTGANLIIAPNLNKRVVINMLDEEGIDKRSVIIDTLQLTIKRKVVDVNPKIFIINNNHIVFSKTVEFPAMEEIESKLEEFGYHF